MAKILITPLGKGVKKDREYSKGNYRFSDSDKEYVTSFIAAALSQHLKIDKMFIIGTSKSMWEEVYSYFKEKSGKNSNDEYYTKLASLLWDESKSGVSAEDLYKVNETIDDYLKSHYELASCGSECVVINYGINEEELWENFDLFMKISNKIRDGDEVYLDITHSFRSISLFMYLMMDFIYTLRAKENIKLAGIYYGMLDVMGELGYAPVVDLKPLFEITNWTKGVYDFINYGSGYLMASLIKDKNFKETLKNISDLISINYIKDLKSEVDKLDNYFKSSKVEDIPVITHLMPQMTEFIDRFKGLNLNSNFQFELAKWNFENRRYANGFICLAESMVTRMIDIYAKAGENVGSGNYYRECMKHLLRKILNEDANSKNKEISDLYQYISNIRNNIAHAGFLSGTSKGQKPELYKDYINEVDNKARQVKALLFDNMQELMTIPQKYPLSYIENDYKKNKARKSQL